MATPAWETEFTEYFSARVVPLRRLGYALCGDWHLAEDLVQTTFVKLYRHWRRTRAETVDAYTRRILVNTFLSHRRSRLRELVVQSVPEPAPHLDGEPALDLGRALARLPRQQRAVVVLRHLEDLSVAEVAQLLGVAEGTVKSQNARGLQALRLSLNEPALASLTPRSDHG